MASIEVYNVYTNVPIDSTLHHPKPNFNKSLNTSTMLHRDILKSLLIICTKEAPFRIVNEGTHFYVHYARSHIC